MSPASGHRVAVSSGRTPPWVAPASASRGLPPAAPLAPGAPASFPVDRGEERKLVKGLTVWSASSVIVGIMIGSGIFRTPNEVADLAGSSGMTLLAWAVGGVLVLFGGLSYAELGAMIPRSGGAYNYLVAAYGPMVGFLNGWAAFLILNTASLAAVATFFGELSADFLGLPGGFWPENLLAIAAVAVLTAVNWTGVRQAGTLQILFTLLKLSALAAIIVLGALLFRAGDLTSLTPVWPRETGGAALGAFGLALVPVLWTYDGWTNANNVAGEIRNPQRNLPLAILFGVLAVAGVYLLANFAYMRGLGFEGMVASDDRVASDLFDAVIGDGAGRWVTAVIAVTLLGTLNGQTLAYPRVYLAMATDGLFFRSAARVHDRFRVPHVALAAQFAWCVLLIFTGTFETLTALVIFGAWIFYALVIGSVFVLRRKMPDAFRPYRVWGYPALPALVLVAVAAFTVNLYIGAGVTAILGTAILAAGIPVYFVWRRFQPAAA